MTRNISLRDLANAVVAVLRAALITGARGLPCEILFADEPQPTGRFRVGQFLLCLLGFRFADCGEAKNFPADHQGPSGVRLVLKIGSHINNGLSAAEYFEGAASRLRELTCPLPGLDAITISLSPVGKIEVSYDAATKCDIYTHDFAVTLKDLRAQAPDVQSKAHKRAAGVKGTPAAAIAANPDQSSVADLAASSETGIA